MVPKASADSNNQLRELMEIEIKHWQLDKGLARFDTLADSSLKRQIEDMLKQVPELGSDKPQKALTNWKRLGPLTLEQIMERSEVPLDFDESVNYYKMESYYTGGKEYGQFRKDVVKCNGVGRAVYPDGQIYEGQFRDGKPNGYGRNLWADGQFYAGQYKNNKRHGIGRLQYVSGKVYSGVWSEGNFVGAPDE